MRRLILIAVAFAALASPAAAQSSLSPGYAAGDAKFNAAERAGREIWFFATAFNDRFYTYSYAQRLGGGIDWFRVLAAKREGRSVPRLGRDPRSGLLRAGRSQLPEEEPRGDLRLPVLPGRRQAARIRRQGGLRDPACDFKDAPFDTTTPHGAVDQRQSACDLRFGTSTGALGLRKFPNPRFDAGEVAQAQRLARDLGRLSRILSGDKGDGDARTNRLFDGSVEPPFRIGMACGACHIAYDPLKPPADVNNPKWENIDGLVGNQYSRISQDPRIGHVAAPARMATDRARAARHGRYLGAADGHGVEPRHHERDLQFRAPAAARAPCPEMAQGFGLPGR